MSPAALDVLPSHTGDGALDPRQVDALRDLAGDTATTGTPAVAHLLASYEARDLFGAVLAERLVAGGGPPIHLGQSLALGHGRGDADERARTTVTGWRRRAIGTLVGVTTERGGAASSVEENVVLLPATTLDPADAGSAPDLRPRPAVADGRAIATVPVPAGLAARFADLSGDRNPIHLDEGAARAAGFAGPVVHGTAALHLVLTAVVRQAAACEWDRLTAFEVRYGRAVAEGDALEVSITAPHADGVRQVEVRAGHGRVFRSLTLWLGEE